VDRWSTLRHSASHPPVSLSPLSWEQAADRFIALTEINHRRVQEIGTLLEHCESLGIRLVPLKGFDLLLRAYAERTGLRAMADVDLLVHPSDVWCLDGLLRRSSYEALPYSGNPTYQSSTQGLILDVQSEIWYLDDQDLVWHRTVVREVDGRPWRLLHPNDALIYLVAHQTIHRGHLAPQMAADVAALIDAEQCRINWHRIVEHVRACGLSLPVSHGFKYARRRASAQIPIDVIDTLEMKPRPWHAAYRTLVTETPVPEIGHLLRLCFGSALRHRLLRLRRTLLPRTEFLVLRYGEACAHRPLITRVGRISALGYQGARLLGRIVRRLVRSALGWRNSMQAERPLETSSTQGPPPYNDSGRN
jgi:hypothetical protein